MQKKTAYPREDLHKATLKLPFAALHVPEHVTLSGTERTPGGRIM